MNNSNKTLLQILVEELPKIGGWPDDMNYCGQSGYDNELYFYRHPYTGQQCDKRGIFTDSHRSEYAYTPISRDQYEAALAASKELRPYQVSTGHYTSDAGAGKTASAADADGWIEWAGGECPLEKGTIIDTKDRDGHENFGEVIGSTNNVDNIFWQRGVCSYPAYEIIAYRLHQPQDANSRANDERLEADLNDCIGQPQSNEDARDEILYELANFAATTKTSLDIGVATEIAIWLSGKGYRKQ